MKTNIMLCGFMGCGKTTVGIKLAKKLGYDFVDSDKYIEEKCGMSVSNIFEIHGEQHFRDLEHKACRELSKRHNTVVSTGGGALTFDRNLQAIRENSCIILLDVPLYVLKLRLSGNTSRPLLNGGDRDTAMQTLFDVRMPLYEKAMDIKVDAAAPPTIVADRIISLLETYCE